MESYLRGRDPSFWRVVKEDGIRRLHIDYLPNGNGLGSRVKGLVSAWRLNPTIDEFSTHFPVGDYWFAKFSDLFDVPCVDRTEPDPEVIPSKWVFQLTPEEKWYISQSYRNIENVNIENCYENVPYCIKEKFIPYFKKLKFKPEIYQRADDVLKDVDIKNCIGVLVRDMEDYVKYHRAVPLNNYIKVINKLDRKKKIILCCQTQTTLETFQGIYKDRIIVQKERYDAKDVERMKEVATNMVLLSRCPILAGFGGSCFMEASWYYGECKAEVHRVGPGPLTDVILLTGASGKLGKELKKQFDVLDPTHSEMDITDETSIQNYIKGKEISLIIHCAAYTSTPGAEQNKELCFKTNAIGTLNLAKLGIPMVHISTDGVFEGNKGNYRETDFLDPIGYYNFTKCMAEMAVLTIPRHVIIRTAFKERPFPHYKACADKYSSTDYVDVIAKFIAEIVHNFNKVPNGIYHVGTERKSIYELAKVTKPDVKPMSYRDVHEVKLQEDSSLNLEKWNNLRSNF